MLKKVGALLKKVDWIGVLVALLIVGLLTPLAYLGYDAYKESQRTGIITCVDPTGNTMRLPFSGGVWSWNEGVLSFYSPLVETDIKTTMPCVVVYGDK